MLRLVRHLIAILVLPFTMTVLIPLWVARRFRVAATPPASPFQYLVALLGLLLLGLGLTLFLASLRRFAGEGEGTLAPWDPPRQLVVRGPYRYVRNPMISGVIFILLGEAGLLRSTPHLGWAVTFLVINALYIPLLEEPMLERRFGESYRRYKASVPGLLPRLRPWNER